MAKKKSVEFESKMVTVFNREPGRLILECAMTVPVSDWSKADTPEKRFRDDAKRTLRALAVAKRHKLPKHVRAFMCHLETYLKSALRKKDNIQSIYSSGDPFSAYPSAAKLLRDEMRIM